MHSVSMRHACLQRPRSTERTSVSATNTSVLCLGANFGCCFCLCTDFTTIHGDLVAEEISPTLRNLTVWSATAR